jgi:methylated-DNA-protein-cysteine methyltransferase-like protein
MTGPVFSDVYKIVRRIPRGKVLTYGMISHLMDGRLSAQGVGWALKALASATGKGEPAGSVPWQRVINSSGRISTHKNPDIPPNLQRVLLEKEGVKFDGDDKVDLGRYLWTEIDN